jgi:hypothetical protein
MTCDFKAMPSMAGDSILRRWRLKDNTPSQFGLGADEWLETPTSWYCKDFFWSNRQELCLFIKKGEKPHVVQRVACFLLLWKHAKTT